MIATYRKKPSSTINRNRRQRKKLHIGEFKEVVLTLRIELDTTMHPIAKDVFFDRFITEAIEPRDLNGFGIFPEMFSIMGNKGTVTQEDVNEIHLWLKSQPQVLSATGEIRDAWY